MNYGLRFVNCTEDRDQDHSHGKEMQKSKMAVWGALTNSCEKKRSDSWVEAWNSACLSRCPRGERPLVDLYLEPGVFSQRCTEKLPLRVDCIHRLEFGAVSGHRVLIKRGPGNRGPTECGTTHEATSGMSS